MQLLKKLEPVGVLQLKVNSEDNDLQESVQHAPGLGLEHSWNEVG